MHTQQAQQLSAQSRHLNVFKSYFSDNLGPLQIITYIYMIEIWHKSCFETKCVMHIQNMYNCIMYVATVCTYIIY